MPKRKAYLAKRAGTDISKAYEGRECPLENESNGEKNNVELLQRKQASY